MLGVVELMPHGREQDREMLVVEPVLDISAASFGSHEAKLAQHPKLLGNRVGRHTHRSSQLINADRATGKCV